MRTKYLILMLVIALALAGQAYCQNFSVGTGGITIKAGTTFFVDSLVLTPSADLTLTSNSLTSSSTGVSVNGVSNSVNNVFTFSASFAYSGAIQLGYLTTGLNGNTANELVIAYDSAASGTYHLNCASSSDTVIHKVTSSALSGANLYNITAVKSSVSAGTITGATTVNLGTSTTLANATTGGTWSSNDTTLATVTSGGVVTGVAGGADTIVYTVSNTCSTASQKQPMNVNANNSWVGTTSNDWSNTANWSTGVIPTVATNAIILSGTPHDPNVLTGTYSTKDMSIATGATVTINSSATLNIKGNLTNNGNVTGAGTLSMNSTAAQAVGGIGSVSNFDVNNAAGASVTSGSRLTIKNVLSVTSGTLATGDSVVLYSDTFGTARVTALPSGTAITGNVKVNQFMTGGRRAYRFWAHPFNNYIPLNQLTSAIDISGPGGAANGFTTTASNQPSSFWYNPYGGNSSLSYDPGWRQFASTNTTTDSNRFKRYEGIRIYYRGSKGQGLGFGPYINISSTVISQTGVLNQGNQSVTLSRGSSALQDYNMVGNPYASPVDIGTVIFNAAQSDRINGAYFWMWNPFLGVAGQFQAVPFTTGGTTPTAIPYYIQANDAFQVRARHDGDQLNFAEANKSATISNAYSLMKSRIEFVSLYLYDANYHPYDMFYVKFDSAATDAEDARFDGGKPSGADVNLYSLSADSHKLSVDARPYTTSGTIPLGMNSAYAQDYIIRAENLAVPEGGVVYLYDKLLNKTVLLQQGTEYRFSVTAEKNTQGENRFELSMMQEHINTAAEVRNAAVTMSLNPTSDLVCINFEFTQKNKAKINITNITGVPVYAADLGIKATGRANISMGNFASGIYMVEVTCGDEKIVQKLVKE